MQLDISIFVIICGLFAGSFGYSLYNRIPANISLLRASYCPNCEKAINLFSLIPILSYLLQLGRCRNCKCRISPFYPLAEIIGAILSYAIYLNTQSLIDYLIWLVVWLFLIVNGCLDLKHRWLSSLLLLISIAIASLQVLVLDRHNWLLAYSSMLAAAGFFYYVRFIYSTIRNKEMLGEGDVTMVGILALLFKWQAVIGIIFWSAILGISIISILALFDKKWLKTQIPYAFLLILIAFVGWLFPQLLRFKF